MKRTTSQNYNYAYHHSRRSSKKIGKYLLLFFALVALVVTGKYFIGNVIAKSANSGDSDSENLLLVNKWNPLSDDYKVDLTELSNGQSVATSIYPALQEMFDKARADGVYPVVASGYRTKAKQQSLLDEKIAAYENQSYSEEKAETLAKEYVSEPGTSEHETGLAVDINADPMKSTAKEVYTWLYDNAYQYGFILRYPEDKEDITGTNYEAWHYRYVGKKAAKAIHEQGICLEEYLDEINESETSE